MAIPLRKTFLVWKMDDMTFSTCELDLGQAVSVVSKAG